MVWFNYGQQRQWVQCHVTGSESACWDFEGPWNLGHWMGCTTGESCKTMQMHQSASVRMPKGREEQSNVQIAEVKAGELGHVLGYIKCKSIEKYSLGNLGWIVYSHLLSLPEIISYHCSVSSKEGNDVWLTHALETTGKPENCRAKKIQMQGAVEWETAQECD